MDFLSYITYRRRAVINRKLINGRKKKKNNRHYWKCLNVFVNTYDKDGYGQRAKTQQQHSVIVPISFRVVLFPIAVR